MELGPVTRAMNTEGEREEWRGKAERYHVEWTNCHHEAQEARHDLDEAEAAKEMWRSRALKAEAELETIISG